MSIKRLIASTLRGTAVLAILMLIADPATAIKYDNTKDFTWIMVFAAILAFLAAYGIGANDVSSLSLFLFLSICLYLSFSHFLLILYLTITLTIRWPTPSPLPWVPNH
jgi:uncharacterized membrane protein